MKKITIAFCFLAFLIATSPCAFSKEPTCSEVESNLSYLLEGLRKVPKHSYDQMKLSFLTGLNYARLNECSGEEKYAEMALQAFDFAEKCKSNPGVIRHPKTKDLIKAIKENREELKQKMKKSTKKPIRK